MRLLTAALVLLVASPGLASGNYPVIRWVIEGDTQTYAFAGTYHPNPWDDTHTWLCANATAKNLQGVIGTGDIINRYGTYGDDLGPILNAESVAADHAFDILDACGLESILPAGNHDFYGNCGNPTPGVTCPPPPNTSDRYLAWMAAKRPMHDPAPASRSASGLSWTQVLAANYHLLVLPFGADAAEEAWASAKISASAASTRYFIIQHEAVDPSYLPNIRTTTAAGRIAAAFGQLKVPAVLGGHYIPADRVQSGVNSLGQRALFVNFQESLAGVPFWGRLVWLEYYTASGQWCFYDEDVLTGTKNVYEATTCWVP